VTDFEFDISKEYAIGYAGSPQVQILRLPTLEIGGEYILLNVDNINSNLPEELDISMWLKIKNIDGIEYVYPYAIDCSELSGNIPITDVEEAYIHTDPVVIEYMAANNIERPVFEYKFELNDFISQVKTIRGK
jgi:hypothetical protein